MKKTLFLLTFLLIIKCTFSQIPIGQKYDINGTPLNGYYDPITYSPEKKISFTHNSDSYEDGYYYDKMGKIETGLIKFQNKKIFFKKDDSDLRLKIKPEDINHLVIGVDSFFVINNFYYKNRIKNKPEFAQYITDFNGFTFVKHYHFSSGLEKQLAIQSPIVETYLVKTKDSLVWDNFPNNQKFKDRSLKYFQHIPYLKDKISSGVYKSKDIMSIIKMAEYYDKFKKSEAIFYDKYWQEHKNADKAVYSAKILTKIDSIWTFEYYDNKNVKLFKAQYSSFYPNIKNGDFTYFYPSGLIRQITSYLKNKPTEVKTYNKQGELNTHYQFIKNKDGSSEYEYDIKYLVVNDALGNNILNLSNSSFITYNDIEGHTYTSTFKNSKLISNYWLMDQDTIFQVINSNYNFKTKKLQQRFDYLMSLEDYTKALNVNAQGMILVSFIIDKKGYAIKANILNNDLPLLESLIQNFIDSKIMHSEDFIYRFKPYKKDKIKRYFEILIPFEFSINRFYRQPVNYYHYNHFNNFPMHHPVNTYTPPMLSMPSGF